MSLYTQPEFFQFREASGSWYYPYHVYPRKTSHPNGIYPIGYILEDYIVIKSNEIPSGNYIYAGAACCRDEYFSLNCNFETFFDRYIMANAGNYWRWQAAGEKFDFIE